MITNAAAERPDDAVIPGQPLPFSFGSIVYIPLPTALRTIARQQRSLTLWRGFAVGLLAGHVGSWVWLLLR